MPKNEGTWYPTPPRLLPSIIQRKPALQVLIVGLLALETSAAPAHVRVLLHGMGTLQVGRNRFLSIYKYLCTHVYTCIYIYVLCKSTYACLYLYPHTYIHIYTYMVTPPTTRTPLKNTVNTYTNAFFFESNFGAVSTDWKHMCKKHKKSHKIQIQKLQKSKNPKIQKTCKIP